ncbi:hypothetical protein FH608_048060 [Nonomuraea phyllanthi]|uniref:Uncharacterized protein n=1 Tax=Nonomuraea phyllanthi TaxID=2219224 RepID=A0A5C4V139_9ACTN|nr:hypothetical protein [Nonomuraea phyllanthi]KAB8184730.1 hypothetical protein FH608_048060 [Nonomuraea phyllanthi]
MHDEREALPAPAAGERLSIYALPENTAHESGHTAADYTLSAAAQQRIADGVPGEHAGRLRPPVGAVHRLVHRARPHPGLGNRRTAVIGEIDHGTAEDWNARFCNRLIAVS